MKLGQVLRKERERVAISKEQMIEALGCTEQDLDTLEGGDSPAEIWGPRWALLAIQFKVPASRLLAKSGKSKDCNPGQAGQRIRAKREELNLSIEHMAEKLGIGVSDYETIEAGESPLEEIGPVLLRFAETVEQPVFNFFYPHGLPFAEIRDYP